PQHGGEHGQDSSQPASLRSPSPLYCTSKRRTDNSLSGFCMSRRAPRCTNTASAQPKMERAQHSHNVAQPNGRRIEHEIRRLGFGTLELVLEVRASGEVKRFRCGRKYGARDPFVESTKILNVAELCARCGAERGKRTALGRERGEAVGDQQLGD